GITQSPDAEVVDSGSPIGFMVSLVNGGDGSADELSVTDTLPSGSAVDWAVDIDGSDDGWVVTGSPPNQQLVYNSSTLHGHGRIKVHVISETSVASCGSYANHVSFSSHNGGWGSASNSISVNCPPAPPPPP